jgi:eukaryotic-like serine/threonine-protein kinase
MAEVVLTIAGGAACMTLMGVGAWLIPRLVRRSRRLRSVLARLRWRTTFGRIVSWVEAERPDLRRASAPDGTVTLLFSDIENSSRLTERLGDQRWLEVLNAHNTIVRAQLDEHGGYEVKSQGDGFMLAFPSARQAVRCAIDIQRALARRAANGELPLRVRIGIHTGEAIQHDGDFYGRSVILAARIADRAQGGEVLVSSLVEQLVESAGDLRFKNVGEAELKGLSEPQRIYRVAWGPDRDPFAETAEPSASRGFAKIASRTSGRSG